MVRLLPYVVPVALALYALIDLSRSEPGERADLTTTGWVLVILLLPVVGPVAWIVVSRLRRSSAGAGSTRPPVGRPSPGPRPRRSGPLAPDDDPDFLWRLEQERRRREGGDGPTAPGDAKDGSATD